jgi:hypothetical protein
MEDFPVVINEHIVDIAGTQGHKVAGPKTVCLWNECILTVTSFRSSTFLFLLKYYTNVDENLTLDLDRVGQL